MSSFAQDLRYALRSFRKSPGFTLVAILTLALGIGATTAIFSAVDALLLRPLPFAHPEELAVLDPADTPVAMAGFRAARRMPDLLDWQEQTRLFQSVASYSTGGLNLTGGDAPARVSAAEITPNFFTTLGLHPALGRAFLPEESHGRHDAVILSDGLWRRQFGADPRIAGKSVSLNGRSYLVVGVMPRGVSFPRQTELWIPAVIPDDFSRNDMFRSALINTAIARLAPGLSLAQAQAGIRTVEDRFRQAHAQAVPNFHATLTPLRTELVGDSHRALLLLMGAVGFVLLIACANIANLLLARAAGREKEIALRAVLGATRGRLVRQLLVESIVLALAGGVAGLLVASWGVSALGALTPRAMAGVADVGIDARVLIFTLAASLVTGVVIGLVPALSAARANLSDPIKGGGGSRAIGVGARRVRSLLVVSEVALALVLLIGSGLMLKSFYRVLTTDTGMHPERVVTMSVSLPRATYPNYVMWAGFYERALAAIRATPGVTSAGAINDLPLGGESAMSLGVQVVGRPAPDPQDVVWAQRSLITPGYLSALGVPIVRGRDFTDADDAGAPKAILINQTLAHTLLPNGNPLGQQLHVAGNTLTIVGVVGDVRGRRMDRPAVPQMFMASTQLPSRYMSLVVRTAADPTRVMGALRAAIHSVDATLPVYNMRTMQAVVSQSMAPRRSDTLLLALFAALALVLATLGIYGVMAYTVARRTREIGIRMALGAELRDVMAMVLRHGLGLTLTGVVIGIAGALALTRVLASLLFEVSATDPLTFVGVTVLLVIVAVLASYIPARRAARVNPVIAMRVE